jgi:pSer/pThr/pTyr-binding forkhead associated (FHA) protein
MLRLKPTPALADPPSTTPKRPEKTIRTRIPPSRPSHRISFVPIQLASAPSINFDPITLDVEEGGAPLSIGRFTVPRTLTEVRFKSKVVSRYHAEIWVESGGKFFIRDTKSSSGTFVNSSRLSPPSKVSRPFQLRDGDILQLGVSYQGGVEDQYKPVVITVEMDEEPQATPDTSKSVPLSQLSGPYADTA